MQDSKNFLVTGLINQAIKKIDSANTHSEARKAIASFLKTLAKLPPEDLPEIQNTVLTSARKLFDRGLLDQSIELVREFGDLLPEPEELRTFEVAFLSDAGKHIEAIEFAQSICKKWENLPDEDFADLVWASHTLCKAVFNSIDHSVYRQSVIDNHLHAIAYLVQVNPELHPVQASRLLASFFWLPYQEEIKPEHKQLAVQLFEMCKKALVSS